MHNRFKDEENKIKLFLRVNRFMTLTVFIDSRAVFDF